MKRALLLVAVLALVFGISSPSAASVDTPAKATHQWSGHEYTLTPTAHDICWYVKPSYASTVLQYKNFTFYWHPMVGCMWWLPSSGNAACWMIDRYAPNGSAWIPCPLP